MKYVMLFGSTDEWSSVPADRASAIEAEINEWWGRHSAAGTILGGERLQGGSTATTYRLTGGTLTTVDGPFIESKEEVSGFGVIEVADLDAALELARSWPALQAPGESVEVRPVVEM